MLVNLEIDPDHPHLLMGLEIWVQLGLIDDREVLRWCRNHLTCRLPIVHTQPEHHPSGAVAERDTAIAPVTDTDIDAPVVLTQAEGINVLEPAFTPALVRPQRSVVSDVWEAFKDELSVRWLLFLGVFLVLLSSGVLAATQWQRFPAWGQYGVLWIYTIGFWGVGMWASVQPDLRLTANALKIVALLLIPVNFWAIDSLQLWHHLGEWLMTGWAMVSLTGIVIFTERQHWYEARLDRLGIAYVGTSYLELGWRLPYWATIAVYLGAIAVVGVWPRGRHIFRGSTGQWASLAIYGLTILLLRALLIEGLPLYHFGLAIGIVGWLVAQWELQEWAKLERLESMTSRLVAPGRRNRDLSAHRITLVNLAATDGKIAAGLLAVGWLLGMGQWLITSPMGSSWQPVAVDVLILIWLGQRLQRRHKPGDLVLMFLVGLQTYGIGFMLVPNFIPHLVRWDIWNPLLSIFGATGIWAVTLVVIPYLWLWVGISEWWEHRDNTELAHTAEILVFCSGLCLTMLSTPNQLGLLLNLLFSTLTLIYLTHRGGRVRTKLIYVTHLYGLGTIAVAVNATLLAIAPIDIDHLVIGWGSVVAILAIGELLVSSLPAMAGSARDHWYRSAWHYGLGLAGISYGIYVWSENLDPISPDRVSRFSLSPSPWIWLWFLIPIGLTWLGYRHLSGVNIEIPRSLAGQFERQIAASGWSVCSLLLAQVLTIGHPNWRLGGLGLAVGLMFANVWRLRTLAVTAIHLGFGLAAIATVLERWVFGSAWLVVGALAALGLWVSASQLRRREGDLAQLYAQTADGWAIGLSLVGITIGTMDYIGDRWSWWWIDAPPSLIQGSNTTIASVIVAIGFWYRDRFLSQFWTLWGIHWTLQLGLSEFIHLLGGSTLTLAIVDITIAFPLLWITGKSWQDRRDRIATAIDLLPWLYGVLGMGLRLPYFTAYTGLLTIAVGIISLPIGRRWEIRGISYLGFITITSGCYELLTYQLLQAPSGGNIADGLTIYGFITALLALAYRLGIWWWERRRRTHWLNLPISQVKTLAHLHWAGASGWKVAAALVPPLPAPKLTLLHLGISILLGIYAIIQGRDRDKGDWWVYVGMVEILGTGMYARSIFTGLGIFDESIVLAACLLGLGILLLPWSSWGWEDRPWRRVAVILPLLRIVFVAEQISLFNLLVTASFYAGVAKRQRQFGWIYVSLIFVDWAAFRLLSLYQLQSSLWYATILGLSLLMSVQFDPYFHRMEHRDRRHTLRLCGSGAITFTALLLYQHHPLLPAGISLLMTLVGIALRIRAFLYMGTITLLLTASYQLIILIAEYPLTKWIVGLVAGVTIITIAANFERRREQIYLTVQNWLDRLQQWQ
jgi:hypothetical protein